MWKGLALHTWTLDTTPLAEVLRVARTTGWDAIELRRLDFKRAADRGEPAAAVLDLVRQSGLPVACVGVEMGWMFAEGIERRRLLAAFDESCGWANALGCSIVMSPVDRGQGPVDRAAASLREVGDIAGRHDVRLALEFNSQAAQFNTLPSVREVLRCAQHPRCGVLLDTYHFGRTSGDPGSLDTLSAEELVYIQYSDVPRSGLEPGKALDRLPPGQGAVPWRAIFSRGPVARYDGYLSYEAPNPAAWARNPEAAARDALEATRAALSGVAPAS